MKPDQRTTDAIARLKNSSDYRVYTEFLKGSLDEAKDLLITAQPIDVPRLQGRAKMLSDLLAL